MTNLKGLRILVTRPSSKGEPLCEKIQAQGGIPFFFPTLQIDPLPFSQPKMTYDWIIFVSPQAVYRGKTVLATQPLDIQIAAMGVGTAKALKEAGFSAHCFPITTEGSEALLQLPELKALREKKILIVKGKAGRSWLKKALLKRGAAVTLLDVYQRVLPSPVSNEILNRVRRKAIDVILTTSCQGMENLKQLLSPVWQTLKYIPLYVISPRMLKHAKSLGFKRVLLSSSANDEIILEQLAKDNAMENEKIPLEHKSPSSSLLWLKRGLLLALFTIIALAVIDVLAYLHFSKIEAAVPLLQKKITDTQKTLTTYETELQRLTGELNTQTQIMNAIRQTQTGYNRDEWRILQAESLVELAQHKIEFENNAAQAARLLQAADKEIHSSSDENLLPLREALAKDIVSLQSVATVDVSGMYLKLSALNAEINKMPLPNKPSLPSLLTTKVDPNLPWWKRGLQHTFSALQKIVIVRYHESDSLPLVTPDQQLYLS
jgi:uroporphyrinogen-III synthase